MFSFIIIDIIIFNYSREIIENSEINLAFCLSKTTLGFVAVDIVKV